MSGCLLRSTFKLGVIKLDKKSNALWRRSLYFREKESWTKRLKIPPMEWTLLHQWGQGQNVWVPSLLNKQNSEWPGWVQSFPPQARHYDVTNREVRGIPPTLTWPTVERFPVSYEGKMTQIPIIRWCSMSLPRQLDFQTATKQISEQGRSTDNTAIYWNSLNSLLPSNCSVDLYSH